MKKKIMLTYEFLLIGMALFSVIFLWSTDQKIIFVNRIVWFVFFLDVLVRFIISKHKWRFIKENPFDIIAALPLDSIFQTARIVRLVRLLRFFSIGKKYLQPVRNILQTNSLGKVLTVSVIVLIAATVLVTFVEPDIDTFADGLWWSLVTTTTVGYGDLSPTTGMGRLIAMVLMLIGIGIIGTLTSSITTYFVRGKEKENPTVHFIKSELDRYEELTAAERNRLELLIHDLNSHADELTEKNNK